ncbi:MAG: PD-(D/E)XK nuclease family protein [Candidatus Cardinium sp.]|nr:MAG: PD-(D/E)XK nuclease family protein [Candidatus Cardinium sp.]
MRKHSKLTCLPTLDLLRRLHGLVGPISKESFEQFYGWGLTLLQDFNRIDSYLVDGAALFTSLPKQLTSNAFIDQMASLKKDRWLLPLEQKEGLLFWKQLPLLYQSFREKLMEAGEGYEGLCYSMAQPKAIDQELVFVGFNLLTPAEERFIEQCQLMASTTFFWDVDRHYLDNPINIAGHYLRQHREKKWFQESFPTGNYLTDPHKKVFLIEASTTVAQVQAVIAALQEKINDSHPKFLPNQTAIVVSGSDLLIPLLDQLATLSIPLHCRLDYPFSATVIYTVVERLVQLWETSEKEEMYGHMAHLLALWHPFAKAGMQSKLTAMRQSLNEGKQSDAFDLWFNKDHQALLPYLREGLTYIYNHFIEGDHLFFELNKRALDYLLGYIEGLEMATCSGAFLLNGLKESRMLFHQDNPVTGLYIIEVAESYNLDFEHVFFLDMNEGCFPKVTHHDSFLPYDLCHSFGLPLADKVAENKTAYGFYRLLQRAQNICCYFSQKGHLDGSGEMSRLLLQLTFDSKLKIIETHHSINLLERPVAAIAIQKDDSVMQLLDRFLEKEEGAVSSLTPSACISYLSCPLQFYFKYLLQLRQTVATEDVQLGILFHDVMARLYRPFAGSQIDTNMVRQLQSKIKVEIAEAIAAWRTPLSAPMLLHALLEKLLGRMLDLDDAAAPFTLLGVEVAMKQSIMLDGEIARKVWLSGTIDRIDRQNHCVRIIDYKTGRSNCKISSIVNLFDPGKIKTNKAVFQLFFYAWLFQSLHGADNAIMPYLIPIREFFLAHYTPGIFIQQPDNGPLSKAIYDVAIEFGKRSGKKYQQIEDIKEYLQPFEEGLKGLLVEIFNPTIPFAQTEDLEICGYCPYVRICQRD